MPSDGLLDSSIEEVMLSLPGLRLPSRLGSAGGKGDAIGPDDWATTLRTLWALPKVELHLHLTGTLRPATVARLAGRYEPASPLARGDWSDSYWSYRDLAGFIPEFRRLTRTCVRAADDYYLIARECFEDLAAQNVLYAEVSFGPRAPGRPGYVPLEELLGAIDQARREVERTSALRVGLLLGLHRPVPAQDEAGAAAEAIGAVEGALAARERGIPIVGVDLDGDEQSGFGVGPLVPAFRIAAEAGLGLRAHAGEGAGAASIWECLDRLGARRIAHGTRAAEDSALIDHLAREDIALDTCPVSNVRMGLAASLAAHPIRALRAAGVTVTVSSDAPVAFETTVTTELAFLQRALGFSLADLHQITRAAASQSFLPEAERQALVRRIDLAWSDA